MDALLEDTWGALLEAFMQRKGEQARRGYFGTKWYEEGREEGRRETLLKVVREALEIRFGPLPTWAEERLEAADLSDLAPFHGRAITAESLEAALR